MQFRKRWSWPVAAIAALGVSLAGAQTSPRARSEPAQSATIFQANAHLAVVDVVVTDRRGMLIHGLKAEDFHVFENGVEQRIGSFEEHVGGGGMSSHDAAASLPPNTYSNVTSSGGGNKPLYVILLDSLNTSVADQAYAQSELIHMVEALPPSSRVAVFRLGAGLTMLQGFSEDASELAATLKSKKVMPQLGTFFNDVNMSLAVNIPDPTAGMGGGGAGKPMSMQGGANDKAMQSDVVVSETIRALKELGTYLSQFPGRKELVWLAGTFPIDTVPSTGSAEHGDANMKGSTPNMFLGNRSYTIAVYDLAILLQSANIAVYPVDVRGVLDNGLNNTARGASGNASLDANNSDQTLMEFTRTNGQIHSIMETIAKETGGRAYYGTNDLKGAMLEAYNNGSNYYTLSYTPSNQKWDGKFRKIHIQAEEAKLYYRNGYYAEAPEKLKHSLGGTQPEMTAAMVRGGPAVIGIPLQLRLTPEGGPHTLPPADPSLKSRDGHELSSHLSGPVIRYQMEYIVHASDLRFSPVPPNLELCKLEVSLAAFDEKGKMVNSSVSVFDTPLKPETYAAVEHDALHLRAALDLPLGRVYLRVGVHDLTSDKIGAFEIPLNVTADNHASR